MKHFYQWDVFSILKDNLCDNVLDLINGKLIVENNLPYGTYCQWLISARDDVSYVTLEFQNLNVNIFRFKRIIQSSKSNS